VFHKTEKEKLLHKHVSLEANTLTHMKIVTFPTSVTMVIK